MRANDFEPCFRPRWHLDQWHFKYVVPTNDQMIVKFTVDKMDPICMSVGRSSALKDLLENYTDIAYFCQDKIRSGDRYGLGKLSYVTESSDALHLFDKKVRPRDWPTLTWRV